MLGKRRGEISVFVFGLLALAVCGCDEKMPMVDWLGHAADQIAGRALARRADQEFTGIGSKGPHDARPAQGKRSAEIWLSRSARSRTRSSAAKSSARWRPTAVPLPPPFDTRGERHRRRRRKLVCDLWGRRPDAEAAQVLADVLASDSDKDVRMAAVRALGQCHDAMAVRALGTLNDTDPAMQYRAMVSLKRRPARTRHRR